MSGVVTFASIRQEQEWDDPRLFPLLKEIIEDFAEFATLYHGWIPRITSIFRTPEENEAAEAKTTIHCAWRAADVRTKDVPQEAVDDVGKYINKKWIYDPKRPHLPVAYWAPHGSGPHIHVQAHQNTKLRESTEA